MREEFLYFHQLPQNIIGYIMSKRAIAVEPYEDGTKIYYTDNVCGAGISLGDYILLDYFTYYGNRYTMAKLHELGHTRQSKKLGWLYLIIIGIPSLISNIIDRLFHKKWNNQKRCDWYYNLPWEAWADRLGEVNRKLTFI